MTEQPRTCRACGASNRTTRELCGTCGADLDSGTVPPNPVRREAPDPPTTPSVPIRHSRWVVPVIGAIVLVAVLVVGLTLAGIGPLVRGPDVPPVSFDGGAYDEDPGAVGLSDVATLTMASGSDVEAPAAIADGDPTTAWRSDGTAADLDPETGGETIDLYLEAPAWIERFVLHNGDQLDAETYRASARLGRVRLTFDGGEVALVDLLDHGLEAQEIVLPDPILTTVVRIDVLDAYDGEDNDELALSEVALVGWVADDGDAATAAARAELDPADPPMIETP